MLGQALLRWKAAVASDSLVLYAHSGVGYTCEEFVKEAGKPCSACEGLVFNTVLQGRLRWLFRSYFSLFGLSVPIQCSFREHMVYIWMYSMADLVPS